MYKINPMKKLLSILLIAFAFSGFSQISFEQKSKVIDINANFGVYNTVGSDSTDRANGRVHNDKGAPYGFALGFEYGVLNWLGVGLKGQTCTYLTSQDTVTKTRPTGKANDIMLVLNAHLLRKKHFDLLTGFDLGYSGFKYSNNDVKHGVAKGGGFVWNFHVQPRLYFGKHFGMYMNISYISYAYPKLKLKDDDRSYTDRLKFKASGINVGIGFQFKF